MITHMEERVKKGGQLTIPERDLFTNAFKQETNKLRFAIRVATHTEKEERNKQNLTEADLAFTYKYECEKTLVKRCDTCLELLVMLLGGCEHGETGVIYGMMQGDYNRYKAEFQSGKVRESSIKSAQKAYDAATEEAENALLETHPLRLSLALNYAIFLHDFLDAKKEASRTAALAYNAAVSRLEVMPTAAHVDAAETLRLLKENLLLWGGGHS